MRGTAYGRTFELRADDDAFLDACLPYLPHGWQPTERAPERMWEVWTSGSDVTVWADVDVLAVCQDPGEAVGAVTGDLELWVAERARRRVFVHAGCVVHERGAVLLPGRTHAGKSTLTAALVERGLSYFSDEFAVLDAQGWVRPYARPLRLRTAAGLRGVPTPVERFGRIGRGRARVAVVAHLTWQDGARWDVQPMSPGEQVLRLLDNTVAAQSRPRAVLGALSAAVDASVGLRGVRGSVEEAADRLLHVLATPLSAPRRPQPEPAPG